MRRFGFKIATTILLLITVSPPGFTQEKEVRTCIMFFSYQASFVAYQTMLDGFNQTFKEPSGKPISFVLEYLDLGRTNNEAYGRSIVEMYNQKYYKDSVDLIITVGPGTLPFLKSAGLKILENSPSIAVDIFISETDSVNTTSDVNVLPIYLKYNYFTESLNSVCALFPDRRNVYCVNGDAMLDSYFKSIMKDFQNSYMGTHKFINITGISIDSTLRRIATLPEESIVVVCSFNEDINGLPFSTPEVANLIAEISKVPVFILGSDSFPKDGGIIGGLVINYQNVGREFGKAANQIIKGADPKSIAVNLPGFYQYIYDWQELKRWNLLDSKVIPEYSTYINQYKTLFDEYKRYFLAALGFIIFQTLTIYYLIALYRSQKKVKQQILENQYLYSKIVREDRLSKMTELTASLSHELNQPLTAILYSAQAGMRFLESDRLDREQAKEIFKNIIADDKRAGGIISSVRSMMKLETREKEKVLINPIVEETLDLLRNDIVRNGIRILTRLDNSPIFVFADKIQLQQVLLNFFRNSIDAMEENDPGNKKVEVTTTLIKDSVTVSVIDSGPGIDKDIIEKIFKPFVTKRKNGFGIGMAVSRAIIENHDGQIWAENIPGGGAEFSFRLKVINTA